MSLFQPKWLCVHKLQRNGWSTSTASDTVREMIRLALAIILAAIGAAWGQIDDFDDGNSDGWTRSDVLAQVGGTPAEFTFPDGNRIRLKSSPSPDPEALGPSRVGLFREDVSYTDVTVVMDMVAWDAATALVSPPPSCTVRAVPADEGRHTL